MDKEIDGLKQEILRAREYAKQVFLGRQAFTRILSGIDTSGYDIEFPIGQPDIMHVYTTLFGERVEKPVIYRLAFNPLIWVGISHPWGMKPADIVVE